MATEWWLGWWGHQTCFRLTINYRPFDPPQTSPLPHHTHTHLQTLALSRGGLLSGRQRLATRTLKGLEKRSKRREKERQSRPLNRALEGRGRPDLQQVQRSQAPFWSLRNYLRKQLSNWIWIQKRRRLSMDTVCLNVNVKPSTYLTESHLLHKQKRK